MIRRASFSALVMCAVVAAGLLATSRAHAQSQATTGVIRGVVSDPSGNPVADAVVDVRNLETNLGRRATTNQAGVFVATLVPVGRYELTVRAPGF
ncbi:MAG: carboxypeptidase-like regulatory domain-containing protein, partial [Gemmatimonadales bacterium]